MGVGGRLGLLESTGGEVLNGWYGMPRDSGAGAAGCNESWAILLVRSSIMNGLMSGGGLGQRAVVLLTGVASPSTEFWSCSMDRLGRVLAIQHGRRPYLHFSHVAVLCGEVRRACDIGRKVPVDTNPAKSDKRDSDCHLR